VNRLEPETEVERWGRRAFGPNRVGRTIIVHDGEDLNPIRWSIVYHLRRALSIALAPLARKV